MRVFDLLGATRVEEDNSAAVTMSMQAGATKRSRFYHIDLWWMKEEIDLKELAVVKVDTNENTADLFTKQLPVKKFVYLRDKIMGDANAQSHFTTTTITVGKVNVAHFQEKWELGMSEKRNLEEDGSTQTAKKPKTAEPPRSKAATLRPETATWRPEAETPVSKAATLPRQCGMTKGRRVICRRGQGLISCFSRMRLIPLGRTAVAWNPRIMRLRQTGAKQHGG